MFYKIASQKINKLIGLIKVFASLYICIHFIIFSLSRIKCRVGQKIRNNGTSVGRVHIYTTMPKCTFSFRKTKQMVNKKKTRKFHKWYHDQLAAGHNYMRK